MTFVNPVPQEDGVTAVADPDLELKRGRAVFSPFFPDSIATVKESLAKVA